MRVVPLKWDERTAGRTNGWDLKDLEFFLLLLLWTNELIVQLLRIIMKQRTFAPKLCSSSPPFLPRNLSRCGKYSAPYTTLFVALVISSSFIQRRRMVGNCFSMRNSESKDLLIFLNGASFSWRDLLLRSRLQLAKWDARDGGASESIYKGKIGWEPHYMAQIPKRINSELVFILQVVLVDRMGERTTAMRFSRGISALNCEDCFQKNNTGKSNSWRSDFGQEYSIHRNNKFTKRKMG